MLLECLVEFFILNVKASAAALPMCDNEPIKSK